MVAESRTTSHRLVSRYLGPFAQVADLRGRRSVCSPSVSRLLHGTIRQVFNTVGNTAGLSQLLVHCKVWNVCLQNRQNVMVVSQIYTWMQIFCKPFEIESGSVPMHTTSRKWHMENRMVTWLKVNMTAWRRFVLCGWFLLVTKKSV